mmetsp:Transcript_118247/g.329792  ORF Transcript_118247/g.329792 Transcript_118247/m.329792 type:complete len:80 (-) Transcript_118247:1438-1677(-)
MVLESRGSRLADVGLPWQHAQVLPEDVGLHPPNVAVKVRLMVRSGEAICRRVLPRESAVEPNRLCIKLRILSCLLRASS